MSIQINNAQTVHNRPRVHRGGGGDIHPLESNVCRNLNVGTAREAVALKYGLLIEVSHVGQEKLCASTYYGSQNRHCAFNQVSVYSG